MACGLTDVMPSTRTTPRMVPAIAGAATDKPAITIQMLERCRITVGVPSRPRGRTSRLPGSGRRVAGWLSALRGSGLRAGPDAAAGPRGRLESRPCRFWSYNGPDRNRLLMRSAHGTHAGMRSWPRDHPGFGLDSREQVMP